MPAWSRRARHAAGDGRPLLVRARERPELFGEFFAEAHERVLRFFARRVLDPETAFDLMAETFAAAFESLGDFRGTTEDQGHAWLWAIARNRLYRWRQRGEVEQRCMRRLGIEVPSMSMVEYERAEELADLARVRERLARCLETLAPDQREAIRLRVVDERDYDEIAALLGVSETVVRARVSRGLRRLALVLEDVETELSVEEAR
ncbi:MAG TPA: RNA polymerase sigma factor [Solirubrobacteraceae bacterium]|nr:RNA polymerase sigma factor [Solirubrobacteraceae bacterium]